MTYFPRTAACDPEVASITERAYSSGHDASGIVHDAAPTPADQVRPPTTDDVVGLLERSDRHDEGGGLVLPLWLKALLQLGFAGSSIAKSISARYNTAVGRCVPPKMRDPANAFMYARAAAYQAGGRFGAGGSYDHLFSWEEDLVGSFPDGGRLLLGAAGSGRELSALAAKGFRVVAFEPSALVALAAERVSSPRHLVLRASYRDLADGILCQRGPMTDILREGPFDGVILGWGSLSHVWDSAERSRLFSALRRHSPHAPIVASFLCRREARPLEMDSDITFIGGQGFGHLFVERDIQHLASEHGYQVGRYRTQPYPHALFRPIPDEAAAEHATAEPRRRSGTDPR